MRERRVGSEVQAAGLRERSESVLENLEMEIIRLDFMETSAARGDARVSIIGLPPSRKSRENPVYRSSLRQSARFFAGRSEALTRASSRRGRLECEDQRLAVWL
jgi:hypothetical protein